MSNLDKLDEIAKEIGGTVRLNYSGRGMFGAQCMGIDCKNATDFAVVGFEQPSMEELEESVSDGVCESVFGEMTEPDGWDSEGSPSWLLALGLV